MNKTLYKETYNKTEAPVLQGTKLDMAIKGIDRFHKVRIIFSLEWKKIQFLNPNYSVPRLCSGVEPGRVRTARSARTAITTRTQEPQEPQEPKEAKGEGENGANYVMDLYWDLLQVHN